MPAASSPCLSAGLGSRWSDFAARPRPGHGPAQQLSSKRGAQPPQSTPCTKRKLGATPTQTRPATRLVGRAPGGSAVLPGSAYLAPRPRQDLGNDTATLPRPCYGDLYPCKKGLYPRNFRLLSVMSYVGIYRPLLKAGARLAIEPFKYRLVSIRCQRGVPVSLPIYPLTATQLQCESGRGGPLGPGSNRPAGPNPAPRPGPYLSTDRLVRAVQAGPGRGRVVEVVPRPAPVRIRG